MSKAIKVVIAVTIFVLLSVINSSTNSAARHCNKQHEQARKTPSGKSVLSSSPSCSCELVLHDANKNPYQPVAGVIVNKEIQQEELPPVPKQQEGAVQLDFAVVGFPKCGTTSLMQLFSQNNQTAMHNGEKCYKTGSDEEMKRLFQELGELVPAKFNSTPAARILRGFKCPTNIVNVDGLHKMKEYKNDTKLIVGIRHPVRWFESFYNFRVLQYLIGVHNQKPPNPQTLIGRGKSYLQLNTDLGRFELSLMQLGKTELNTTDLSALAERGRRVIQSPFPVFIYTVEQLEDGSNQEEAFRKDLQMYLQLQHPFEKIPRSNAASDRKNVFDEKNATMPFQPIDICEEQHENVRKELVKHGKATAGWILHHFINHPDVMIGGNDDEFRKVVQSFVTDPCLSS